MIEASAFGKADSLPASSRLWNASWAVAWLNKFNATSFAYFDSREAADAAASESTADRFQAIEVVPAIRRLRNDAEISRLTADAEAGDDEAQIFLALWPSILKTAGKSAGQQD
jgi:protein-disulfide isomerase